MQDDAAVARLEKVTLRGRHSDRLTEVSLTVHRGVTAVMGASGAGKTSLLNVLVGYETADEGHVKRQGSVAWVPSGLGLWPGYTASEHLAAAGAASSSDLLAELGLDEHEDARPQDLSLGQRARLAVARALASPADCLVMDEPLAHVDLRRRPKYWRVIRRALGGRSLIFSSHEPEAVLAQASRVCCLIHGRLRYSGKVEALYDEPDSESLAHFLGCTNWLEAEERRIWLGRSDGGDARSIRPESLEVLPSGESHLRCLSYRSCGLYGESLLHHELSGRERRFLHRSHPALKAGDGMGVRLQWLGLFLICLLFIACGGPTDLPSLSVDEVKVWRLPIDGPKLPAPRSVATGPGDQVVVLDGAGRVLVFDRDGELRRRWSMPEVTVGRPEGVVVFDDGHIVVCDTHYHRIVTFNAEGRVVRIFGRNGRGPGEFIYPVAITKDAEEHLYIGEYGSNDRIQKFTREGEHLLSFGTFGTEPGQFQRPSGIVWHDGLIYVADAVNNRLQTFKEDGTFFGITSIIYRGRSVRLHLPYDLALDARGRLWVVEYGSGRILQCTPQGALLGAYGRQGAGSGQFNTPWGLTVDSRGHLRVADTGNHRLVALRISP